MTVISGIHKETHVEYGAILTTGKKGFDFSLFDEEYNTIKLRNSFVGNPGRYNGHDLLRLLNSSSDGEIDYYVYITATGDLERKLSSGFVSFTDVVSLFRENKQLVRTPVWVIGIDIDDT